MRSIGAGRNRPGDRSTLESRWTIARHSNHRGLLATPEALSRISIGQVDLFVSVTKYISGTDTHDGQAYTVGATFYFSVLKRS